VGRVGGRERVSTADLIEGLVSLEEQPWATWYKGKAIFPKQLAEKLRGFGIKPRAFKEAAGTIRGYLVAELIKSANRYVSPHLQPETAECLQMPSGVSFTVAGCGSPDDPHLCDTGLIHGPSELAESHQNRTDHRDFFFKAHLDEQKLCCRECPDAPALVLS
jgi:hypothetical protein